MNPPSPVYDPAPANPFVVQPDHWNTDDVANTRAHNYLRKKIDRVKFLIDHPPNDHPWNEVQYDNLLRDLDRWVLLLNKAHYN